MFLVFIYLFSSLGCEVFDVKSILVKKNYIYSRWIRDTSLSTQKGKAD